MSSWLMVPRARLSLCAPPVIDTFCQMGRLALHTKTTLNDRTILCNAPANIGEQ